MGDFMEDSTQKLPTGDTKLGAKPNGHIHGAHVTHGYSHTPMINAQGEETLLTNLKSKSRLSSGYENNQQLSGKKSRSFRSAGTSDETVENTLTNQSNQQNAPSHPGRYHTSGQSPVIEEGRASGPTSGQRAHLQLDLSGMQGEVQQQEVDSLIYYVDSVLADSSVTPPPSSSPDPLGITARDVGATLLPFPPTTDCKVVLNIGGVKFTTYKSTLSRVPNTKLANLDDLDPSYDPELEEYFFDRNPKFFTSILDFYRCGELHFSQCLCGPSIKRELDFWLIDDAFISACCWKAYKTFEDEQRTLQTLERTLDEPDSEDTDKNAQCHTCISNWQNSQWRKGIWNFLDNPRSSRKAMAWAVVIFLLILSSIAVVCMQTHPSFRVPRENFNSTLNISNPKQRLFYETTPHDAIEGAELTCIIVFTLELTARFILCPSKFKFIKSVYNLIDIFCVIPMLAVQLIEKIDPAFWDDKDFFMVISYLSLTSVLRVFRLFKLARHYRGLKILQLAVRSSLRELILLFMLIFMGMLVFSTLIYFAEFSVEDNFMNIPIGFWWSIVTMTTVGYGDIVPQSGWGYLVGGVCAVAGMLATGLPIPIIASNFNHYYNFARLKIKLSERLAERKKRMLKTFTNEDAKIVACSYAHLRDGTSDGLLLDKFEIKEDEISLGGGKTAHPSGGLFKLAQLNTNKISPHMSEQKTQAQT